MKKLLAILLAFAMIFAVVACQKPEETKAPETKATETEADSKDETEEPTDETEEPTDETDEPAIEPVEGAMSYAEYAAAELETEVTIAAYLQAKQKYAEAYGNTTLYMQDEDGGYFVYRIKMSQEEYDTLELGQRLKITGFKAEWSGEVEITDATFEIIDGVYYDFAATDVTEFLGTDELADYMNRKVAFSGMTVAAKGEEGAAFFYNWDGSGEQGSDIYFDLTKDGETYTFVVESDLCDQDSEVYKAVEALKVGDVIDLQGFLYWYNGMQPHVTSVTVQ